MVRNRTRATARSWEQFCGCQQKKAESIWWGSTIPIHTQECCWAQLCFQYRAPSHGLPSWSWTSSGMPWPADSPDTHKHIWGLTVYTEQLLQQLKCVFPRVPHLRNGALIRRRWFESCFCACQCRADFFFISLVCRNHIPQYIPISLPGTYSNSRWRNLTSVFCA